MSSVRSAAVLCAALLALGLAVASSQEDSKPKAAKASEGEWSPSEDIGPFAAPPTVAKGKFDRIRSGMTLRQLADLLGRGWMRCQYEGCGIIRWTCVDGRELHVWPTTYRAEEVIDAGPRQVGGTGGRGRMWMIRPRPGDQPQDVPISQK